MATWHQRRNTAPLYHSTKFEVVVGGYNQPEGRMLFDSLTKAEMYLENITSRGHTAYILTPHPQVRYEKISLLVN